MIKTGTLVFPAVSGPALGSTSRPTQFVTKFSLPGSKAVRMDTDPVPSSSATTRIASIYTIIHSINLHVTVLN